MSLGLLPLTSKKMAEVHGNRTNAGNAGEYQILDQGGAESGALDAQDTPFDSGLQTIIERWPSLSEAVRESILKLATGGE